MTVDGCPITLFKFHPGDWVKITFADMGYTGRVASSILNRAGRKSYSVEYAADGAFKDGTFEEDELEMVKP